MSDKDLVKAISEVRRSTGVKRSVGEFLFDNLNVLIMIVLAIATLYPFWYIIINSLSEGRDAALGGIWFLPRKWTLANYSFVILNSVVANAYKITVLRTVSGSLLTLLVCGFAAYALTKHQLPGRKALITFFIIPMFIGGTIVSYYVVYSRMGMLNRFWVYIIPGSFSFFQMIIMRTFMYTIPTSLEESAKIDGASYFRIFFRIIVPLSMPIVATTLLFSAVGHWLDFYTNMVYVNKRSLMTLQYLLWLIVLSGQSSMTAMTQEKAAGAGNAAYLQGSVTPQSIKMATIIVVTLPILVVYPFLQRYFVQGVLIGSVKE
jgi:putative aldouronate transport system permease protein